MKGTPYHVPVLLDEALSLLLSDPTQIYVDATVGGGGHALEICRRLEGSGRLLCLDADEDALEEARKVLAPFEERVSLVHANFREIKGVVMQAGGTVIGGLLMDLGVSSHQLDEGERGFSFRSEAALNMRMDRSQRRDASAIVNEYAEEELSRVLWEYGEERSSRRIAKRIVAARPLRSTGELRAVVEAVVGGRYLTKSLARVFQAIRIEVNDELRSLKKALEESVELLAPGGRLVVISYHSLEDRIVKEFMRGESATRTPSGHKYIPDVPLSPRLKVLTGKPVRPGEVESSMNPRARSAKLRAAERVREG